MNTTPRTDTASSPSTDTAPRTDAELLTDASAPAHRSAAPDPLRVTLVVGSNRHGRFGPVVADWLLGRLRAHPDFVPDVVDVATVDLPTSLARGPGARTVLAEVSPKLAAADAFVVLTPEYNHSYPAGLKNLVDWHYDEWRAKPVALVSYGGMSGGLRAVEHLRQVFAELHAVTVRDTVSFHHAGTAFDDEGTLKDSSGPDAAAKLMLDQLAWWAHALRDARRTTPYAA